MDLSSKFCMQQHVYKPTHGGEILELVFVNNHELVVDVGVEDWPDFSDHRLVEVLTNFRLGQSEESKVEQHLTVTAGLYKVMNFKKAPWPLIEEELAKVNWDCMDGLSASEALNCFHEKVLEILVPLVPKKPENPRIRKMKMQRLRRRLKKLIES